MATQQGKQAFKIKKIPPSNNIRSKQQSNKNKKNSKKNKKQNKSKKKKQGAKN